MKDISHKKNVVAHEREEKVRQYQLTKVRRIVDRASKEAIERVKAIDKEKMKLLMPLF